MYKYMEAKKSKRPSKDELNLEKLNEMPKYNIGTIQIVEIKHKQKYNNNKSKTLKKQISRY